MKFRMNDQTRIIVATAVALTVVDLGVRSLFLNRTPAQANAGVIVAREIKLVDDQGNLRAHMYTDENSEPGMVMYDRANTQRLQIDTWEQVPSLILNRPDGERSTYYGMDSNGLAQFSMYGMDGGSRVSMDANDGSTFRSSVLSAAPVQTTGQTIYFRSSN